MRSISKRSTAKVKTDDKQYWEKFLTAKRVSNEEFQQIILENRKQKAKGKTK